MTYHEAATTVRELPEPLPARERVLWRGAPRWRGLARRVFHVRGLAFYFSILIALRGITRLADDAPLTDALVAMLWLLPLAAFALTALTALAWLSARATWYTITDRRVVMRIGIVLEITFNFPYAVIESAGLREYADGSGDLPLRFVPGEQIAYAHLWPHARPWHFKRSEPMLRCIPDARQVAQLLAAGLAASAGGSLSRSSAQTASVAAAGELAAVQ